MHGDEKQRGFISYSLKGMDFIFKNGSESIHFDIVDKALHIVKILPAQQPFKINALMLYYSYIPSDIKSILVGILHNIFTTV